MAEDSPPVRSLLIGVVTLVLVALIIGGVFSLLALGAANVTGLASNGPAPRPSMYVPPLTHSPSSSPSAGPSTDGRSAAAVADSPTASSTPTPSSHHRKHRHAHHISLTASPQHVSPSQRIVLSGSYPGGSGTTLQVQNRQGGRWTSFPVTVTVSDGSFHTYIYSGTPGKHLFRVLDPGSGRASNSVAVTIG